MEKKELSQEQIDAISAGAQLGNDVVGAVYHIVAKDMLLLDDYDALYKRVANTGLGMSKVELAKVADALKVELAKF